MASIPMAIFRLFLWLLEALFISAEPRPETSNKNKNKKPSGSSSSSRQSKPSTGDAEKEESSKPSSNGSNYGSSNADKDTTTTDWKSDLQAAFQYFEIENPQEATWEAIKKKYRRLSLIHHPDRNNHSKESTIEMQKINDYYELLEQEFDRRGGRNVSRARRSTASQTAPRKEPAANTSAYQDGSIAKTKPDSDNPQEPGISREEYKRRRKLKKQQRQRAQKQEKEEEKRQQEELLKQREDWARKDREEEKQREKEQRQEAKRLRKERDNEMRRQMKKTKRQMEELKNRHKHIKQENTRMIREVRLDSWWGRLAANNKWMRKINPCNPIMEFSNDDVAIALKLCLTDVAIAFVHESIEFALDKSMEEILWEKEMRGVPPNPTWEDFSKMYDYTYKNVLASPMDEDGNHVLFYAVYHGNSRMLTFLENEARSLHCFSKYITSTNRRGLTIMDFCAGSSSNTDTNFQNQVKALFEEGRRQEEANSVIVQSRYYFQQIRQHGHLEPALFSSYSMFLGKFIFCASWYESLLVVLSTRLFNKLNFPTRDLYKHFVTSHCAWFLFRTLAGLVRNIFPWWAILCVIGVSRFFFFFSFLEVIFLVPASLLMSCESLFNHVHHAVGSIVPFKYQQRLGLTLDVVVMYSVILLLRFAWSFVPPTWNDAVFPKLLEPEVMGHNEL